MNRENQTSFKCPRCGRESHNPLDVKFEYCSHCHSFPEDRDVIPILGDLFADMPDEVAAEARRSFHELRHFRLNPQGEPERCTLIQRIISCADLTRRQIAYDLVGVTEVSTILMGLDAARMWETMTFSNRPQLNGVTDRCGGSREQALAMHAAMVERVKQEER